MIIEFKCVYAGMDVSWISKFPYEREILLPPWVLAATDYSRETYLSDSKAPSSPNSSSNTNGRPSVYKTKADAIKAIQSC